jgi:hypothetical protein
VILSCGEQAYPSRREPLFRRLAVGAGQSLIEQVKRAADQSPVFVLRRLGVGNKGRIDRCRQFSLAIELDFRLSGDRLSLPQRCVRLIHEASLTTRLTAPRGAEESGSTRLD